MPSVMAWIIDFEHSYKRRVLDAINLIMLKRGLENVRIYL